MLVVTSSLLFQLPTARHMVFCINDYLGFANLWRKGRNSPLLHLWLTPIPLVTFASFCNLLIHNPRSFLPHNLIEPLSKFIIIQITVGIDFGRFSPPLTSSRCWDCINPCSFSSLRFSNRRFLRMGRWEYSSSGLSRVSKGIFGETKKGNCERKMQRWWIEILVVLTRPSSTHTTMELR